MKFGKEIRARVLSDPEWSAHYLGICQSLFYWLIDGFMHS
jgi:hypothetical protein